MANAAELLIFVVLVLVSTCVALFEGDSCVMLNNDGGAGRCISFDKCEYAKNLLQIKKIPPQNCGFRLQTPAVVCCPQSTMSSRISMSEEKCQEYHNLRSRRTNVAFGQKAKSREFPHMVALGYGDTKSQVTWLCGGSLISELFVLTAAHCINTLDANLKWVHLGDLVLNDTKDDAAPEDIKISKIFVHPKYKPPSLYNDIALIKLRKPAKFRPYVLPACIYTKQLLPNSQFEIIGWGLTDFLGDRSNHLLKASLNIIEHKTCSQIYSTISTRKLSQGIKDESQICAGDASGKDTCPGDSGGPLHFIDRSSTALKHHVIVGITSFGKGCGFENSAGVYTRVSFYKTWIENIVWPVN